MSLALLLLAQAVTTAAPGPDLAEVERAVGKCDSGAMTKIFSGEPQRRRAATIAIFTEQQAIVEGRRALAQRRLDALRAPVPPAPADSAPPPPRAEADLEAQTLADRQQALDDARMLGSMRDNALDMMRQQYLVSCNAGFTNVGK